MDIFKDLIKKTEESVKFISDDYLIQLSDVMIAAIRKGKKIIIIGNGGSCADAQHIAAEFTGRYKFDRPPMKAMAQTNVAEVTAISNDYDYVTATTRFIENWGVEGDVLIAISTSGESANVLEGVKTAKDIGMKVISFSGSKGQLNEISDYPVTLNSTETPVIQNGYMMVAHHLCFLVENGLFENDRKAKFRKN